MNWKRSSDTDPVNSATTHDSSRTKILLAACFLVIGFFFLFLDVFEGLVREWWSNENYSHGFLIVPIAGYLAWERRSRLKSTPVKPRILGMGIMLMAYLMLLSGKMGSELFMTRIAIPICLVGAILYVLGWDHLRILSFPVGVLLLMIPIPAIIFNQVAFPLQILASRFGEFALSLFSIPVLREGNVIVLAKTTLEVAEACSGIRSLVSLLTLGIIYGYLTDPRLGVRTLLAVATVPVAILANGLRVAGTGIAAHYYGASAAEGFFHTFSGWLVFIAAFVLLFIFYRLIVLISPARRAKVA